jgi:hypothetical protein
MPSGNVNTDNRTSARRSRPRAPDLHAVAPTGCNSRTSAKAPAGSSTATYIVAHPREWLDHSSQTETTTDERQQVTVRPHNPNPKVSLAEAEGPAQARALRERRQRDPRSEEGGPVPRAADAARRRRRSGEGPPTSRADRARAVVGRRRRHRDAHRRRDAGLVGSRRGRSGTSCSTSTSPTPPDERRDRRRPGWPYVRAYTPLDVLDWRRDDNGELVWIKLLEATNRRPRSKRAASRPTACASSTKTGWKLYDYKKGKYIDQGEHNSACCRSCTSSGSGARS